MKKKYFYSHIVETSSVSLALADVDLTNQERKHLIQLVEANLHHTIIDLVLSQLSDEDKKTFLLHLHNDAYEKIWTLLQKRVEGIEKKISIAAEDVKKKLHKDISTSQKQS